ncbi:MAG: SIR2 family protein [Candidatus Ozemobacteraceae bacterium]
MEKRFLGHTTLLGYQFAQMCLNILLERARAEKRGFFNRTDLGSEYGFLEGLLPDGIGDIPGPCGVEVKRSPGEAFILSLVQRLQSVRVPHLLLITDLQPQETEALLKDLQTANLSEVVHIWGRKDQECLFEMFPCAALAFHPSYLPAAVKFFEKNPSEKPLDTVFKSLRAAFSRRRLVLVLGSGVSKSMGIPDWENLLKKLSLEMIQKRLVHSFSEEEFARYMKIFEKGMPASPLISARFLGQFFGNTFPAEVRRLLFEGGAAGQHESKLLEEISRLCLPKENGSGVSAILTYNFDTLVEETLSNKKIPHHSIFSEDEDYSHEELPIFHVHGFLPREGHIKESHRENLVFSEESYHAQFSTPYSWSNIAQLNHFSNNTCLFIGLSMNDPNIRRLLEISQRKKAGTRHFLILKNRWHRQQEGVEDRMLETLGRVFQGLEETTFQSLGISVIWVNDFPEVPEILANIMLK